MSLLDLALYVALIAVSFVAWTAILGDLRRRRQPKRRPLPIGWRGRERLMRELKMLDNASNGASAGAGLLLGLQLGISIERKDRQAAAVMYEFLASGGELQPGGYPSAAFESIASHLIAAATDRPDPCNHIPPATEASVPAPDVAPGNGAATAGGASEPAGRAADEQDGAEP